MTGEGPSPSPSRLPQRVYFVGAITLFVLLLLAAMIVIIWRSEDAKPPIVLCVFAAAILGSLINITDRIRVHYSESRWWHVLTITAWKLLASCVLALFAYLFFMSGFIQGPLFPKFQQVDSEYTNVVDFATNAKPEANLDVAKVLVWSFVAGYSERFVAQLIRRLETRAHAEE